MAGEEIIRLKKIFKYYQVGTEVVKALRNINLSILRNEYVAIIVNHHLNIIIRLSLVIFVT